MGYLRRSLPAWARAVLGAGALALIFPGLETDAFGVAALLLIFFRYGPEEEEASRA
jgi:hypothetical protein